MRVRTMLAILTLVVGAGACANDSGAGASPSAEETVFLTYEQVQAEYLSTSNGLELPAGYKFPEQSSGVDDPGVNYGEGVGAGDAVFYWYCAWSKEWLELRTTDPEGAEHALAMVASVTETETYQKHWDPQSIQEPFQAGLEAARLGDPTYFQQEVDANCKQVTK